MAATLDEIKDLVTALGKKTSNLVSLITSLINMLNSEWSLTMSALDDLTAQVAQNTSVEQSAVQLIQGLAAQIQAAANDPVKLNSLTLQLKSSADALAAAITANTPAEPPVEPPPDTQPAQG
jgi:hypothetical protein